MNGIEQIMLLAIRLGLEGKAMTKEQDPLFGEIEWLKLLDRSIEQEILPLVFDVVCRCPSFCSIPADIRARYKKHAVEIAACQVFRTNEFLTLIKHAQEQGFDPVVLKGITVRELYPKPMLRPSVDEDLLIPADRMESFHDFLISEAAELDDPLKDPKTDLELSYHIKGSPTCIELHGSYFPLSSDAYGDCNKPLEGAEDRCVNMQIEDVVLRTLAPTDHLLYLICHAYKHFLHSGVGIRQASDICVFEERFRGGIDGARIRSACESLSISRFAAAILLIGRDHFGIEPLEAFLDIEVDTEPLLLDMLTGGLYGTEDVNRAHSSTMTLEAVASHKEGRRSRGALHSVFLPKRDLEGRYPYLKKHGWLLPIAWIERGAGYLKSRKASSVSPSESLRIGRERVELLKKYGIID